MKYLKKFGQLRELRESVESIESICKKYNIRNYTINEDGSVDVDGNVNLYRKGLTQLPLKFGKVTGYFNCYDNQLISLEGSPREVGGYFDCQRNQLTTLEGAPMEVGGSFYCGGNKLTTLEGAPMEVGIDFYCGGNPVEVIWNLFKDKRFLEKLNGMYTGNLAPIITKDGVNYLRGDILEEIADELGITLPADWSVKIEKAGYTII